MRFRARGGRLRLSIVWQLFCLVLPWLRMRGGTVRSGAPRSQTRGSGLALTEFLRDRVRPRWLRLSDGASDDGTRL